jgi:periplasmic protein TonB
MATHKDVSYRDTLDIVFANRNRAYGAYQLRREYDKILARAFFIGLAIIGLGIVGPHIWSAVAGFLPDKTAEDGLRETHMIAVEIPTAPPPPVVTTPPPPPKPAIQFVPPVVAPDDQVNDEKPQDIAQILDDDRDVGTKTVDGPDADAPPTLDDPEPAGLGFVESPTLPKDDEVYDFVNKPPSFPGGEADLLRFLAKNIEYPTLAKENNVQGLVVLTFVVGKDGSISDVAVVREIGGSCGKEAVRVVKSMPRWIPGEANGHPVKVRFTLPVRFKLN